VVERVKGRLRSVTDNGNSGWLMAETCNSAIQGKQNFSNDETASEMSISFGRERCKNGISPNENVSF